MKPWMIKHLLASCPVVPVLVKACSQEASGLRTEIADLLRGQVDVILLEQPLHIWKVFSIERHSSAEKDVNNNRGTPNVNLAIVWPLHEYLGSHIARAAKPLRQEALVLRDRLGETKVSQLDNARLLVDENIVKFYVSVCNVHPV